MLKLYTLSPLISLKHQEFCFSTATDMKFVSKNFSDERRKYLLFLFDSNKLYNVHYKIYLLTTISHALK